MMKSKLAKLSAGLLAIGLTSGACAGPATEAKKDKTAAAQAAAAQAAQGRDDAAVYAALVAVDDAIATDKRQEASSKYIEGDAFKGWPEAMRFLNAWLNEDFDRAWKDFDSIAKDDPGFYWAYVGIGRIYDVWKIHDQAEANFEKAKKLNPGLPAAYFYCGMHYLNAGDIEKAGAQFDELLDKNPEDPNGHFGRGSLLMKQGKLEEAVAEFEKAGEGHFTVHRMLGSIHRDLGNKEKAVEELKKCAGLYPANLETKLDLAKLLDEIGRLDEALDQYKSALSIKGEDVDIHLKLAGIYEKLNQAEKEIEEVRAAASLAPDNFEIQKKLGLLYLKASEFSGAEDALRKAFEAKKDDFDVLFSLARIYDKWEKYLESVNFYRKAVEIKADDADARRDLAAMHERLKISKTPITGKKAINVFGAVEAVIKKIYKEKTKTNPNLRGKLVLKVETDSTGAVREINFTDNSLHDPYMEACIYWNTKDAKFPPEARKFTYTFLLEMK